MQKKYFNIKRGSLIVSPKEIVRPLKLKWSLMKQARKQVIPWWSTPNFLSIEIIPPPPSHTRGLFLQFCAVIVVCGLKKQPFEVSNSQKY